MIATAGALAKSPASAQAAELTRNTVSAPSETSAREHAMQAEGAGVPGGIQLRPADTAKTPGGIQRRAADTAKTSAGGRTSGPTRPSAGAQAPATPAQTGTTAGGQFEGIIRSRNRSVDYNGEMLEYDMTIWVKKTQVKVTVPRVGATPGSTVIYRTDSRVSWVLNDQGRTYFEVALPPREEMREPRPSDTAPPEKSVITRTARTRKILGYLCEQVMIRRDDTETEIWGTKELGDLARVLSQSLQPDGVGGEEDDLVGNMGLYPLQSFTRCGGRILESQEVTKIERKTLSDDLFRIPAGYTRQKALDVE